jgi:hypothetical protein
MSLMSLTKMMRRMRTAALLAALLGSTACGSSEATCEHNDQCVRGQSCLRRESLPGEDAPLGRCIDPLGVGGVCYHKQDCKDPLACVLPSGGTPGTTGGTCQTVQR